METEANKMAKQPSYRFAGYTEAWEQRKLGEVAQYRNGKAHENCIDENGKYIVVNSKFISTDGEVKKFSNKKNEALFENEIAFVLSDVPNGRAIARTFWVEKNDKYTLNQRIAGITPIGETFPYFLYILMNRHPYFLAFDDGAKQTNLSVSDVMGFEAYYPKYSEQQKIGAYFRNLDHLITLHQRKLEVLKEQKKTYLKLLFPAKGQTKPALRFAGFEDEWKEVKVSDIFRVTRGQVLATTEISEEKTDTHKYPVYSSQTKNEGLLGYYDKYLFETAITWTTDGANAGTVNYREGKFYSTNVNGVLLSDEGFANKAIAEILNNKAWKYVSKVGNPKLMNNVMSEISLVIPNDFREISTLSTFFQDLDKAITKQEEKVNQLKESKQTLLRKMFI